jgi:glutamate-ammonia-ligase adenylyltransferase
MRVISLEAFENIMNEAWTWSIWHCAGRARCSAPAVRQEVGAMIDGILRMPRHFAKVASDAIKMRADIERHKPPRSAIDVKLGPGGLVDLEFAVHVLQLTKHAGLNSRLEVALEELEAESLVPANIVEALKLLSRMLVMMRLVAPGDVKPTAETWQLVAEACGAVTWDELLAEHDAARQSIAALWNSIKREA